MGAGTRRPRGRNRKGYCLKHKKWIKTFCHKYAKPYDCKTCHHFKKE